MNWLEQEQNELVESARARIGLNLRHELVEEHYAFCNRFLAPLFLSQNDKIIYTASEHRAYRTFNSHFARKLRGQGGDKYIDGYQLALVPAHLKEQSVAEHLTFLWHIPWPQSVPLWSQTIVLDLVASLVQADTIVFQSKEYRDNFLSFARRRFADYDCRRALVAHAEPAEHCI